MYCKKKSIIDIKMYHCKPLVISSLAELKYVTKHNDSISSSIGEELISTWNNNAGFVYHLDNDDMIMCIKDIDIGIICHESVHLAHFIMDYVGIPISLNNTEIEAYLVEFIFDKVIEILKVKL